MLKYLTKLKELNLDGNPVSDLSALKDLKYLEDLDLYNTQVSDLSPINNIKTLKSLSYGYMKDIDTIDISQIKDLTNLEYLGLGNVKVKNFQMINNFINLTNFSPPRSITVEDMGTLTNLKKLKRLDLDSAKFITNIDFILNFPNIEHLFLNKTNIKDISVLKKLPKLTILNISGTQVTDASGIMANTDIDPKYLTFTASNTQLRWCSPKNSQDIIDGKSCFEKDGTLKPFWKRWLGL
ncbi:leucine-rich repeat domain-containing protein [Halarcobacter ebronensis]|uniref:leucine-rich repeat domain-containing protein n=1 Tax=Halarcobacter ebronensis TaxID=1462615 RepID=UPI002B3FFCF1|nr:leucine-rich repeat domain-containing protein [Halarcobacter ebronensis]